MPSAKKTKKRTQRSKNEEVSKLKSERDQYLEGWKRERANFLNYQSQEARRLKACEDQTKIKIFNALLPMLDSFEQAARAWKEEKSVKGWREGMQKIFHQLDSCLTEMEIEKIGCIGDVFDPEVHEAVAQDAAVTDKQNEDKELKIAEVLQRGYRYKDYVIRPARVRVGL